MHWHLVYQAYPLKRDGRDGREPAAAHVAQTPGARAARDHGDQGGCPDPAQRCKSHIAPPSI